MMYLDDKKECGFIVDFIEHNDMPNEVKEKVLDLCKKYLMVPLDKSTRKAVWKVHFSYVDKDPWFEIDKLVGDKYDYFASIFDAETYYELSECYYPYHGAEFSGENTANFECETQINIFGRYKRIGDAFRSMVEKGNSTYNHRKPIEIYT
jgi:hypothetical protein